jgi:hypothetical protein
VAINADQGRAGRRSFIARTTLSGILRSPFLFLAFSALPALILAILWAKRPANLAPQTWLGGRRAASFGFSRPALGLEAPVESLSAQAVAAGVLLSYFRMSTLSFKLIWSEGNRFYDYPWYLASYTGGYTPEMLYNEPGRYACGSAVFPRRRSGSTACMPCLYYAFAAGWFVLARWAFQRTFYRWHFALWVFLLFIQAPIYPSLVISALLVLVAVGWGRPEASEGKITRLAALQLGLRLAVVFLAGVYAALSRWTWLAAPGVWAGLIHFLWDEHLPGSGNWGFLPAKKRIVLESILLRGRPVGQILAKPACSSPRRSHRLCAQTAVVVVPAVANATYSQGIRPGVGAAGFAAGLAGVGRLAVELAEDRRNHPWLSWG